MNEEIKKGLLGIVVDETTISQVVPELSALTYRGYKVQDLCDKCDFEEVAYLVLHGELPSKKQLNKFIKKERSERKIFNVFGVGIREKEYMSEDWYICYKLRELGFEIYVDSSFPVTHMGVTDFSRSLSSHFKKFDYS